MKCLNTKLAIVAHFVPDFLHLKYHNADNAVSGRKNCCIAVRGCDIQHPSVKQQKSFMSTKAKILSICIT